MGNVIHLAYDFINPWCWIGELNLRQAMAAAHRPRPIVYVPSRCAFDLPASRIEQGEYARRRFGSLARSRLFEAQITRAGQALGLRFAFERIERLVDSDPAHSLMLERAARGGDCAALFARIFRAYFCEGRDIGDARVLAELGGDGKREQERLLDYLRGGEGLAALQRHKCDAADWSGGVLPAFRIGDTRVSGAQPGALLARVLRDATVADAQVAHALG
ncbi:DsbA family protein [Pseudomonas chlororaphis]|uniref:DsbA family protein n=1 Tax=Pseudomonas chlororaphis TaxID=587753 RepID=UPI00031D697D|nr:DsbA family protein [Pseudomonas chlororaphis]